LKILSSLAIFFIKIVNSIGKYLLFSLILAIL
jgi:hypothetical protein